MKKDENTILSHISGESKVAEGVVDDNDVVKTHMYYLQNVAILTDRERGYFYNEYFPYIKKLYQQLPLIVFESDPGKKHRPPAESSRDLTFMADISQDKTF